MDGTWTVAELIGYLSDLVNEDDYLSSIWVQGEISNLSQSTAGHCYFTLKDGTSQLKCVMFKAAGKGQSALLQHGGQVLVHGRVGVYEAQGTVQLYVDQVQQAGVGELHLQFEALKARLLDEGLFDEARKRPLPALPQRIGVVTSAQAAAFQDICRVLQERFPAVTVVLAPTLVQGAEAPKQIVAAIEHLGSRDDIDVVIVARGGGSLEDLWAFNDERVARAIVACPIPVVTGVGHETDTTIADFAADLRAPTPSAAAAAVVPHRDELLGQINAIREDLRDEVDAHIEQARNAIGMAARELTLVNPRRTIDRRRLQIDDLLRVGQERIFSAFRLRQERLSSAAAQLAALDPQRPLRRGYALILDAGGEVVRSASALHPDDQVRIQMRDGTATAVIVSGGD